MNSSILREGLKEPTDEEFEKMKEAAVRRALIAELDAADADEEGLVPTEMERLEECDPFFKRVGKRLAKTPKKGKVKYGDLTVEFVPKGKRQRG